MKTSDCPSRLFILVHASFDAWWPFVAQALREEWEAGGGTVELIRTVTDPPESITSLLERPAEVENLVVLGDFPITGKDLDQLSSVKRLFVNSLDADTRKAAEARSITLFCHESEGFWGQSVAEFALALTLCGLRRIPQLHREMIATLEPWDYTPHTHPHKHGGRGVQMGDDLRFSNGTINEKRVRLVGLGNIGSRYADWCSSMGAEVAAWDPFAAEPVFHRTHVRRVGHLANLAGDAQIFAPMLPLKESTRGLVTREIIQSLPSGCLVILVTRAEICDVPALRERVLADELSLAADVFDIEPLPLDDPLLGRGNVVHTPHNAGRTLHANRDNARRIAKMFQEEINHP